MPLLHLRYKSLNLRKGFKITKMFQLKRPFRNYLFSKQIQPSLEMKTLPRKGVTLMNKLFIITLILSAAITSFGFAQDPASHEAIVRQYIIEFWDRSNVAVADEVLASQAVLISPDGVFEGIKAIKSLHRTYAGAFSDLNFTINKVNVKDDVEVEWTLAGTHDGEIFGVTPTWQTVELQGTSAYELEGNKIVKEIKDYDQLDFLEQLGVVLEASEADEASAESTHTFGSRRYGR